MPQLGFKKHFPPKILAGEKTFTLRGPRKDGRDPKPGEMLHMFTGLRQPTCQKFAELPCRFAMVIKLSWHSISIPTIGDLTADEALENFARLDGFENYEAFCAFHEITLGVTKPMRLIAWITRDELKGKLGLV